MYFRSWSGYNDELVWGAAWLYKATGNKAYLNKAKKYYNDFSLAGKTEKFSWDGKTVGVHALMAEFTGDKVYKDSLQAYCDLAVSAPGDPEKSPGGLLWYPGGADGQWGSLRYAANTAFICLQVRPFPFM